MLLLQLGPRELTICINANSVSKQQGLIIINILSSLGFSNYGMSYRVIQWKLTAFSILNQSSNCTQIFNLIVKILVFFSFFFLINFIILERFHMTSQRPFWCSKTKKRRPCWCTKLNPWELNFIFMQIFPFVV